MMQQSQRDVHEKVKLTFLLLANTLFVAAEAGSIVHRSAIIAMDGIAYGQIHALAVSALLLLLVAGDVFVAGLALASGARIWLQKPGGWHLTILSQGLLLLLIIGGMSAGIGDFSQFAMLITVEITLLHMVRARSALNIPLPQLTGVSKQAHIS